MAEEGRDASHYFGRTVPAELVAPESPVVREPISRAPWPALVLAGSILVAFAIQAALGSDAWSARWGLRPQDLLAGRRLETLATHMWSHAGWVHAGGNAAFCLAFGAPVARLFGLTARGAALFLLFYIMGGVLAGSGFALLHRADDTVLVGASGAISAFIGASARLISPLSARGDGARRPRLAPFASSAVLSMTVSFTIANLILGLFNVDVGQGTAPLAWEAHLIGYAAGLLLIGPLSRLAPAPLNPTVDSEPR